ncbi:MAG: hypothetical protein VYE64_00410 [Planctomycetota bacterium]|nr:hypothetical protein [Planctomycetota bacterium]
MTHEITCRGCENRLTFTGDNPGKYIRCPDCGHLTIMALEAGPALEPESYWAAEQGGGLDALIAGLAGMIIAFSCGCLAPFMLPGNLLGLYVAFRSRGRLRG